MAFRFPFSAVVGQEAAKRALLLLGVDPGLKGVIIASGPGSAKTTLARSFQTILPARADLVEIPLNATEDRLTGALDLPRTLATGKRQWFAGLLAEAHGRLLLAEEINLLDERTSDLIAAVLERGALRLEREGVSATVPAQFSLLGNYNPAEGEVSSLLRDRVGLLVEQAPTPSAEDRTEITHRVAMFEADPAGFVKQYEPETAAARAVIGEARERLAGIVVSNRDRRSLVEAAVALRVEGNRADIFAMRAARANAALSGRRRLAEEDFITAIQLVLLPRAISLPSDLKAEDRAGEPDPVPDDEGAQSNAGRGSIEELIIRSVDAGLPEQVFTFPAERGRRAASGRRAAGPNFTAGRYTRSVMRRVENGRIAIDATLRAAAPNQLARRQGGRIKVTVDDLRYKKFKRRAGSLFIFVVDGSGSMAVNRMAQAKGAMARLLETAYLHRDKVALISFRGSGAKTLLPPTRSVELANHLIEWLPTGGASPVASGLLQAREVARLARLNDGGKPLVILLTDGRANVGLAAKGAAAIKEELRQVGEALKTEGIASLVIDTRLRFISGGEGRELADMLGGRYLYLPRADADAIYEAVSWISN